MAAISAFLAASVPAGSSAQEPPPYDIRHYDLRIEPDFFRKALRIVSTLTIDNPLLAGTFTFGLNDQYHGVSVRSGDSPDAVRRPPRPVASGAAEKPLCRTFLLKKTADGIELEKLELPEGQVRVIRIGGKSESLGLILPVGPGQAGDLVEAAAEFSLVARCLAGEWRVEVRRADGSTRDLPPVKQSALASYSIRVNVRSGENTRRAFLIRHAERVDPDENGPVQDLFEGQVPLQPGDFALTTDTRVERTLPSIRGDVPLSFRDGWLVAHGRVGSAPEAPFVVDTGSARTVVDRTLLPMDTGIEPSKMKEYSGRGLRELPGQARGAGGAIESFLGWATLPQLQLADLSFSNVRTDVIQGLALVADSPSGVIGQDFLEQADVIRFGYALDAGGTAHLELGTESKLSGPDVIRVPFTRIGGLIFVRGKVNGIPGYFVLDTGAREAFLTLRFAEAARLAATEGEATSVRGLDDKPIPVHPGRAESLELGGAELSAADFQIGNVPVLMEYGADQLVGLLGNSFLSRFRGIEVDYRNREVRLMRQ